MSDPNTPASPSDNARAILRKIIEVKGGNERPGQVTLSESVAHWMFNEHPLLLEGSTGIGKALALDTPIATTVGFVPMGEITTSHFVWCEDGQARRVSKVFEVRHNRPCYRLTFSDGSTQIADGEHEYNTLSQAARRKAGDDRNAPADPWLYTRTHTVSHIAKTLRTGGVHNHHIPLAQPLDTTGFTQNRGPLPLSPYALGVWLYGTRRLSHNGRISVRVPTDPGVELPGFHRVPGTMLHEPSVETMMGLDELGIIHDDGVPDEYLFGTLTERLDLLAGITDASAVTSRPARSRGQVRIESRHLALLLSAQTLLLSLGVRANLSGASVGAHSPRPGHVSYTPSRNPFRYATAKADTLTALQSQDAPTPSWRSQRRSIVSVEKVPSVPVRCIEVDSPRHLYLAGTALVPTHNSIGYLAGGLAFAAAKGKGASIVVAPHTKALQDQLVHDLDLIASSYDADRDGSVLTHTPTYTVIKGRSSYLCLRKLRGGDTPPDPDAALFDPDGDDSDGATGDVGADVKRIHEWAETTTTGDRSEMDEAVSNKAWKAVSSTADECIGKRCPFATECYSNIVREEAADSDVIVVNQAYLATAMKLGDLLPDSITGVIVDEAHELPHTLSEAFGASITRGKILQSVKATSVIADKSTRVKKLFDDIASACERFDQLPELRSSDPDRDYPRDPAVVELFTTLEELFSLALSAVANVSAATEDDKTAKEVAARQLGNIHEELQLILDGHTDKQVVWAEHSSRKDDEVVFHAAMFDCADIIFEQLLSPYRSVVFTSATLSSDPNDFSAVREQYGFGLNNTPWRWQTVPSPFDYQQQSMIYYPPDMPNPADRTPEGQQAYFEAVGKVAHDAILAADGRALVLCSSRASVKRVSDYLKTVLDEDRNPLLVQDGESSPKHLAKEFAATPHSVLVGTRSFWTGISFEGDTCAVTILDKLPFPPPTDPIIAARTDKANQAGEWEGFRTVSVPEATRMVVQGAGRQIRTITDRGVVIVCDPRLAPRGPLRKSYARSIERALPPFKRASSWDEAAQFLQHINETANERDNAVVVEDEAAEGS